MRKYYGLFSSKKDIEKKFQLGKGSLDNYKILFAAYEYEDYEGGAVVIFDHEGKLFEVRGSHCSCYGLEGQWAIEETTKDYFVKAISGGHYPFCRFDKEMNDRILEVVNDYS